MNKVKKVDIIIQNDCPLCRQKEYLKKITNNKNLYSSLFSEALKINENTLLKKLINVECKNCGLIYKKYWVSNKIKNTIYQKKIPYHPTGKDVLEAKFSYMSFLKKINKLKITLIEKNEKEIKKLNREIFSLLDSIDNKDKNFLYKKNFFLYNLKNNKFDQLDLKKKYFKDKFRKIKKYTRYTGYGNDLIWKYINTNVPKLKNYAEIGCPAWGMMKQAKKNRKEIFFLSETNNNFWNCSKKSNKKFSKQKNCFDLSKKKYNFKVLKNINMKNNNFDYVGIYNYLDHIEKPNIFFDKIFKKTGAIGLIVKLLKNSKTDVQHFTTWTKKSLYFLTKRFNLNLVEPPFSLLNTGYTFYILRKR